MKPEQKIAAAVAVLLALGGAFYFTRDSAKAEREAHSGASTKANLPSISVPKEEADKITKVELKNADKEQIVLEKKGDVWEITKPIQAKANKNDIKSLLDGLKDLKTTDVIDRTTAGYEQYGVADGKGVHFVAYKGADKALDLVFGSSGTRGQMVRVVGTDGIWIAQGYQSHLYTKETKNWRDKSIVEFEEANVASVEIENENGKYIFTKAGDNWSGTFKDSGKPKKKKEEDKRDADKKPEGADPKKEDAKKEGDKKPDAKKDDKKPEEKKAGDKKPEEKKLEAKEAGEKKKPSGDGWEKFDGKKVEDMLRAFKKLNAIDFADDGAAKAPGSTADAVDTGLDDTAKSAVDGGPAKITITFKDGKSVVLYVGKTQKGTNRFVKKPDDPTVWVISSWSADWATAEPSKFEKKEEKKDDKKPGDPHGAPDDLDMGDLELPEE